MTRRTDPVVDLGFLSRGGVGGAVNIFFYSMKGSMNKVKVKRSLTECD